ncbi:MAG: hypothetical protein AAF483_30860 [Planctomycetota bacterium]
MGTSLGYNVTDAVNAEVRNQVVAFLESASEQRNWWAESIILFDHPEKPDLICGDTKLFCLIDDDLADCYMAMKDAEHIVELLEATARNTG